MGAIIAAGIYCGICMIAAGTGAIIGRALRRREETRKNDAGDIDQKAASAGADQSADGREVQMHGTADHRD